LYGNNTIFIYLYDPFAEQNKNEEIIYFFQLFAKPSIMFCDEPTSGLDSFGARNVIEALRDLASIGHTVLATIHQPSSEVFAMFDE